MLKFRKWSSCKRKNSNFNKHVVIVGNVVSSYVFFKIISIQL